MSKQDDLDFIETDIGACGTALWMAELAGELKCAVDYLENENLQKAYEIVRDEICRYAPIAEDHKHLLDELIEKNWTDITHRI